LRLGEYPGYLVKWYIALIEISYSKSKLRVNRWLGYLIIYGLTSHMQMARQKPVLNQKFINIAGFDTFD
jgi:hypothetical protein